MARRIYGRRRREWAVADGWSTKLEYLYTDLGQRGYDISYGSNGSVHVDGKVDLNLIRLGLNKRF